MNQTFLKLHGQLDSEQPFLGQWPLNYESTETNVNWQHQRINTNHYDNRAGKTQYKMMYSQENQSHVKAD